MMTQLGALGPGAQFLIYRLSSYNIAFVRHFSMHSNGIYERFDLTTFVGYESEAPLPLDHCAAQEPQLLNNRKNNPLTKKK